MIQDIALTPITDEALNQFLPESIDMYAQSMVDNGEYASREIPNRLAENEVYSYFPNDQLLPNEHIFSIVDASDRETILCTTWITIRLTGKFPSAFLVWIDILPEYRRQGLAQKALKELEAFARRLKASHIDPSVFANNHSARKLYEQMGYKEVRAKMLGHATRPSLYELRKHLLAVFAMAS